jgi:hypothetical protein
MTEPARKLGCGGITQAAALLAAVLAVHALLLIALLAFALR